MVKKVAHFFSNGTPHGKDGMSPSYHKMPNGDLHSGKTHTKSSKKLFHMKDLSAAAKKKAKNAIS